MAEESNAAASMVSCLPATGDLGRRSGGSGNADWCWAFWFFFLYFAGVGLLFFMLDLDPWTDYGPGGILWRTLKGLGGWFCSSILK